MNTISIGPADVHEAAAISDVLALNRQDPGLYQKSEKAIRKVIQDFLVARTEGGKIVGCAGLHRESSELAETYAVAVVPQCQRSGVGRQLMEACCQLAVSNGIRYLWLATMKPEYFSRYGFQEISKWELPASTLLRKFAQTFEQPIGRWIPAFSGRHTFMRCALRPD